MTQEQQRAEAADQLPARKRVIGKLRPGAVVQVSLDRGPALAVMASSMTRTRLAYPLAKAGTSPEGHEIFVLENPDFPGHELRLHSNQTITWDAIEARVGSIGPPDLARLHRARTERGWTFDPQRGDVLWAWARFPPSPVEKVRPCIVLDVDYLASELLVLPVSSSPRSSNVRVIRTAELADFTDDCPDHLAVHHAIRVPVACVMDGRRARVPDGLLAALARRALWARVA